MVMAEINNRHYRHHRHLLSNYLMRTLSTVSRVNERCMAVQKQFRGHEAMFCDGKCTCCGSIDVFRLEQRLLDDKFAFYSIPDKNGWVEKLILHNDEYFVFYHLFDEPLTEKDYNYFLDLIESVCGSLLIYIREYNKFFE